MKKNDISFDEWQAAIEDATRDRAEKVPPGWVTLETLARLPKFNCTVENLYRRLKPLLATHRVERRKFKIVDAAGRIWPVFHYRLIASPRTSTTRVGHGAAEAKKERSAGSQTPPRGHRARHR